MPSLFPEPDTKHDTKPDAKAATWISAHCDGGARGNPGPAGYGAVITGPDGLLLAELSEFLGFRTNNFAEYSGLLGVLEWALAHGYRRLRVVSDSELMVKQIQGRYKVNSPDLKPMWEEAKRRIRQLDGFEISHALRHKNKDADRLANEAMDRGMGRGGAPAPAKATPYPREKEAPPAPRSFGGPREQAGLGAGTASPAKPTPGAATAKPAEAKMLRGFTRGGVVELLGGARLPDGVFVKVIVE